MEHTDVAGHKAKTMLRPSPSHFTQMKRMTRDLMDDTHTQRREPREVGSLFEAFAAAASRQSKMHFEMKIWPLLQYEQPWWKHQRDIRAGRAVLPHAHISACWSPAINSNRIQPFFNNLECT